MFSNYNINEDEFRLFCRYHKKQEILEEYNISSYIFKKLAKKYNIYYKLMPFKEVIQLLDKTEVEEYYKYHSKQETAEYFGLGSTVIDKVFEYFSIEKSNDDIVSLREQTTLKKYGVKNVAELSRSIEKAKQTKLERYGDANYTNSEKRKHTCLDRYGVESFLLTQESRDAFYNKYGYYYPLQVPECKEKRMNTLIERYGSASYHNIEKMKQTNIERYGVEYNFSSLDDSLNGRATQKKIAEEIGDFNNRKQAIETCLRKYGEDYYINQIKLAISSVSSRGKSKVNTEFGAYILSKGIVYQEEDFVLGNYLYDFKLGKYLLEINPAATHNSSWGIWDNPKDKFYHRNKTLNALDNGFKCIHIWDWTNVDHILYLIMNKELDIVDCGKPVKHIYDIKNKTLTNKESENSVVIYDDGFDLVEVEN